MATLPEGVGLNVSLEYIERPTDTFLIDWTSKQVVGMDNGLAAMRQAVDIILHNERFRWQVYNSNFGSELEDLVGEEYEYVVSELPRRIEEAFSVDSRILSVDKWEFRAGRDGKMQVSFEVVTVFGRIPEEVIL